MLGRRGVGSYYHHHAAMHALYLQPASLALTRTAYEFYFIRILYDMAGCASPRASVSTRSINLLVVSAKYILLYDVVEL